jgi:hypothetical protein
LADILLALGKFRRRILSKRSQIPPKPFILGKEFTDKHFQVAYMQLEVFNIVVRMTFSGVRHLDLQIAECELANEARISPPSNRQQ